MATPRCYWDWRLEDDLSAIGSEDLGEGSEGRKMVWACPEHRERVETHFKLVRLYGQQITKLICIAAGLAITLEILLFSGVLPKPSRTPAIFGQAFACYLVMYPFSSLFLKKHFHQVQVSYFSLQFHLRLSKVGAVMFIFLTMLRSVGS